MEIRQVRDAYLDGDNNCSYYTALATDDAEQQYKIKWEISAADSDDQSDMCDWKHPTETTKL